MTSLGINQCTILQAFRFKYCLLRMSWVQGAVRMVHILCYMYGNKIIETFKRGNYSE